MVCVLLEHHFISINFLKFQNDSKTQENILLIVTFLLIFHQIDQIFLMQHLDFLMHHMLLLLFQTNPSLKREFNHKIYFQYPT